MPTAMEAQMVSLDARQKETKYVSEQARVHFDSMWEQIAVVIRKRMSKGYRKASICIDVKGLSKSTKCHKEFIKTLKPILRNKMPGYDVSLHTCIRTGLWVTVLWE